MDPDREHRHTVALQPGAALTERPRLLGALEAAFPVTFVAREEGAEAVIAFHDDGGKGPGDGRLPTLVFATRAPRPSRPMEVELRDVDAVDRRLRDVHVQDSVAGTALPPVASAEEVLAQAGSRPAWTRTGGAAGVHRVRTPLPELGPAEGLRDLLDHNPLAIVALVHFLRSLTAEEGYEPPPLRAAILFDDPNLRWRTYGFIDYRQLLRHADEHGYHAAMAMIPLDGPGQHRATVDLFRARPDRLSLVMHGNNHVGGELMRPAGDPAALAVTAQAMRRAARFEARYGLRMDRVMTPPHGLCSASVAQALGSLGFDALCAIHPLPWTESVPGDRPLAGWEPAEFAAGCAVIPRMPFSTPFNRIALRAFLDQPLILYGHHADLEDGLEPLAHTAAQVNRLGSVHWASLGEIAARNYASRFRDGVLQIRPYAHRISLDVPKDAEGVLLEEPRADDHGMAGWSDGQTVVPFGAPFPSSPGPHQLRLRPTARENAEAVREPHRRPWPVVRRFATEARDRLRPLLSVGST